MCSYYEYNFNAPVGRVNLLRAYDVLSNNITYDFNLADGFLMRYEWRRDFSNQPSFLTSTQGVLSNQQNTALVGLIWWFGRKEGAW